MGYINWGLGRFTAGEVRDGRSQKLPVLRVMLKDFILKEQGSHWRGFSREMSGSDFSQGTSSPVK